MGSSGKLDLTSEVKSDGLTSGRETDLWNQSQAMSRQDPFAAQYGPASAMPGMSNMGAAAQRYLTDSILGPGKFDSTNLGFSANGEFLDYERPLGAPAPVRTQVDDAAKAAYAEALARDANNRAAAEAAAAAARATFGEAYGSGYGGGGLGDAALKKPSGITVLPSALPKRSGSPTVGVGEMEDAARATRTLLGQLEPQAPEYDNIVDPTIGGTTVGNVANIGNTTIGAPTAFGLDRVAAPGLASLGAGAVERVSASNIAGPVGVTINPFTGRAAEALQGIGPGTIAGPGELALDPVTGQATSAVGGVAPGEFGGSSFLGGPAISDYMNTAGTEAAVTQARQDYEIALNREKSRQAQVGAFGSRGTVEEAGLIAAQERNIAQIRGAGFDRAAQMMESDAGRRQQAGLQSQQLGFQGGMAGQALEAQRRESDAARAQQAALQGQQLDFQGQLQTQQLAQSGNIRGAELGLQASMQGQQLEAQRRSEEAARYQQAGLAGQQLQAQSGMQTQQLQQQASIQGAQNALNAAQSNQQVAMQSGSEQKQLEAARQIEQARLGLSAAQQTQQLGAQAGMQTQQLGTQVAMQNAQNQIRVAEQNMQSALQTGNQQAQIDAQREMAESQMRLDAATRNQQAGLQSEGMGMDAQGQFRQQQLAAAQQLANIGGQTQDATFAAGNQLQQMGAQQDVARRQQMAFDYEQWLRGQEGGAQALALQQSMMPGGSVQQWNRAPSLAGQIGGGLLAAGGLGADIYRSSKMPPGR